MASSSTESRSNHTKGNKRAPADELEDDRRLTKRFNLLNLEKKYGKLNIPLDSSTTRHTRQHADNEIMEVDDSKYKVFIADLDKELAEVESDEDKPIFIPDIEKHLHKIPKHILIGDDAKTFANMQMVLYNVPASLTVPKGQDSVRRAIIESRQRRREEQAMVGHTSGSEASTRQDDQDIVGRDSTDDVKLEDADAMEID